MSDHELLELLTGAIIIVFVLDFIWKIGTQRRLRDLEKRENRHDYSI
jgi:hypothetical protein